MSIQAAALYGLVSISGAQQSVRDLQSVSNQTTKTQGTLAQLSKNAGQIGGGMLKVGQGLLRIGQVIGVAALAGVAASAKVGTSFQAMTELIHTQAGASQAEVEKMRGAIEGMVHEVGTSPTELAKGLYHIESVGVRGAEALDILKASALGAKVGLADMESVTNALTAVWFSGIKGAKSMTDAMAILDGIVGVGNMHLQDLTDSFKSGILGTAATYGVDIRSLGAAIATLTDAGVPADIAATRLNNTLTHLAAPTKQAIGVLKDLGLSQFDLAKDLHQPDGLFVALQDLHDHLAMGHMTGALSGDEMKKANRDLEVATLHLKELEANHNTAASTLLAARNKIADIRAKLAGGTMSGPGIVNGQLTPEGAAAMSKLFGGSRFGATAMQLLEQMDRVQQKYDLITQRSGTFGDNVKKTMETAGFVWGQFKADIEESALAFSDGFLPSLARAGKRLDAFLVGHHADITRMGTELGQWLDKINWKQVEDGANSFVGILKDALAVIAKLPPQLDLLIVGFLGLNKVSGGLLGRGLEDIAGGVLGGLGTIGKAGLRGILSKIPVVGGAAAALTSTPVFVTNWPLGMGLGGGALGAVEAGAAGGASGLLAGIIRGAVPLIGVAAIELTMADALGGWMRQQPWWNTDVGPFHFGGPSESQRARAREDAITASERAPAALGAGGLMGGLGALAGAAGRMADQVTDRLLDSPLGKFDPAEMARTFLTAQARVLDKLHKDFLDAIAGLKKPGQTPAEIRRLAKELEHSVSKGIGNVEHTKEGISELKAMLAGADPATARVLRHAIAELAGKLPGRVWAERQERIARDGNTTLKEQVAIEKRLRSEGFTHAADVVHALEKKKMTITINPQPVNFRINGRTIVDAIINPYTRSNVPF